jgi:serine/threonine-protein kinase
MTQVGAQVGSIRIVDVLGRGGMGDVFLGVDETLRRQVAVKAIRREHRPSAEARARFLREARVLSLLEHPNICRIYNYIEGEDSDYLVLELIRGRKLGAAIEAELAPAQRMSIAEQIAGVLLAAHGQGVIHRDLKPDNVMLTPDGQVKVLDFGLARTVTGPTPALPARPVLLPGDLDAPTVVVGDGGVTSDAPGVTRIGTIVGSPGYMSPEQARGEPVTAASDVYSFGLLLQALFTGRPPYDPSSTADALILRARSGETAPVTGIDPDLATLIERMKSLEPAGRPSAVDVADRLARVREKPRRRRRRVLVTAALVALALFGAVMTYQAVRIGREADRANREARAASEVAQFLVGLFRVSDPGEARGNTITAREILDRGAARIEGGLAGEPLVQARLQHTMGVVYTALGLYAPARELLARALATRERLLGGDHPDVAASLVALAGAASGQGGYDEAAALLERALPISERTFGPDHPEAAAVVNDLAAVRYRQGRYEEAERLARRALAAREAGLGARHADVAESLNDLGLTLMELGRLADAEPILQRALAIKEASLGPDHPDLIATINNLAILQFQLGRPEAAAPLFERALALARKTLGPDHPQVAQALVNLALCFKEQGDLERAEALYRRALTALEARVGPDHPEVATVLDNLAMLYLAQKRYREAEPLVRRALAIEEAALGTQHADTARTLNTLAFVSERLGRLEEAGRLYRQALAAFRVALGPDHADVAMAMENLAIFEFNRGSTATALELEQEAVAIRERALGADHPELAASLANYAQMLGAAGRGEEARRVQERADALAAADPTRGEKGP